MDTVKLKVPGYGKDKRYGDNVYKFGDDASLLIKRGWKQAAVLGSRCVYNFLSPPAGVEGCKSPIIEVDIPNDDEIMKLATRLHARREPYTGWLGEWEVEYRPPSMSKHTFNGSPTECQHSAMFHVGQFQPWSFALRWDDAESAPAIIRKAKNIVQVVSAVPTNGKAV